VRKLAETTAGLEQSTGDPGGVRRGQEGDDGGDVLRCADAAEGSVLDGVGFKVGADDAGGVGAFGGGEAGVDGVDADVPGAELLGEDAGDGVDGALGSGIDRGVGRGDFADDGADVDDAGAFGGEERDGSLRGEQKAFDVGAEDAVDGLGGDGFDGLKGVDASVVDEDIELAVGLFGGGEEVVDFVLLEDAGADGDGLAARAGDFGDGLFGAGFVGRVVDDDGSSGGGERFGDGSPFDVCRIVRRSSK
jgi:hypothetical protein